MEIVKDKMGWRTILFDWKWIGIHIFPKDPQWGYDPARWYDDSIHLFGLGKFLLICWMDTSRKRE